MTQTFKILGYHLELFNRLGKYIGHVRMDTPDRNESDFGYGGRRTEYVQAEATKTSKKFNVDDYFITECIPICGKVIGDTLDDRIEVIKKSYQAISYLGK